MSHHRGGNHKTLDQKAADFAENSFAENFEVMPFSDILAVVKRAWLAGYKAGIQQKSKSKKDVSPREEVEKNPTFSTKI